MAVVEDVYSEENIQEDSIQPSPISSVRELVIQYGDNVAVKGVSFDIAPGRALGILGDNGAGKSSTMRALGTVTPPTSGKIFTNGQDLTDIRGAEAARMVTGYCPDVGGLIRSSTVREHIGLSLHLHRKNHLWDKALELVERLNLMRVIDEPTAGFSHGMSRRLSVILAALSSEKLLILDEPFDGVDPIGVDVTINLIKDAKDAGLGVVLSTHLQELLVRATDDVIVMANGVIVDSGPSQDFSGEKGVQRYLDALRSNKAPVAA